MIKKIKLGKKMMRLAAAAIPCPAILDPLVSVDRKKASVRCPSSLTKILEVSTLFQNAWKDRIATVDKAGLISGKITFLKTWKSVAPSSLAASINSSGNWSMNCFTKNKPTGIASSGIIWAKMVLVIPSDEITKYLGITSAEPTNIIAASLILKIRRFPLKRSFDKTKAVSEVTKIVAATPIKVTIILLNK